MADLEPYYVQPLLSRGSHSRLARALARDPHPFAAVVAQARAELGRHCDAMLAALG